ncbi:phosphatase PAP2 family protein [Niallia endozanthoxylica]|uniref:Phosphatase PAP2 family protein n=1 Tax=Niallia endozanthoxylica TaxID=2036016 RepID=A0A5J5I2X7_9BACI|nr:phosphatase PAP2 family protein [Niallia endozanthoxylica]KAA9030652.1 phosphatase PAP2 family protein [Niallia endozanthoxylica]
MFRKRIEAEFPPPITVWGMTGLLFSSIGLYLFIVLSINLMEKKPFLFDQKVIEAVRSYSSPALDSFMSFMTEWGSTFTLGLLLIISMIWLFVKRNNLYGMLFYSITVAGGGLLNLLLKNFFERERPNVNRIIEADGFSFPSGHSMGSITYYGFLAYLILRSKQKSLSKAGWGILCCLVILLIGISRIYLGVHYPSDVLAGYMAGGVWLILCISLLEILYLYREHKHKLTKSIQKKTKISS